MVIVPKTIHKSNILPIIKTCSRQRDLLNFLFCFFFWLQSEKKNKWRIRKEEMRQKLFEAYEYSPPPTPFSQDIEDIDAINGPNGITMNNIYSISNTKNSNSTTNLGTVGTMSFNNGMKMAKNAITGVETITGSETSGTTISNVDQLSFTNTSSYISPFFALGNSDENVIGYTKAKYGASTTGGNNWLISTYGSPQYPAIGKILVSLSLTEGVWLITYGILLQDMIDSIAVVRVIVGTETNNPIQSNQQGPNNGNIFLNGSLVYRAHDTTTLSLYGYQTGTSGKFVSQSSSSSRQNFFSATRLA